MAFGAPVMAYTASLERDTGLVALFRFGIIPMFLFSGTFFPVDILPTWAAKIAWALPLTHVSYLVRAATLHRAAPGWHWSVLYLVAVSVVLFLASMLLMRA